MSVLESSTFEYNLDYLSGSQANIYLESILLDEVTSMEWTVHQSKIPIYGYASQFFDEMARGAVIVQGQFSINFIQPNYLFSVLEAWKHKKTLPGQTEVETHNEMVEKIGKIISSPDVTEQDSIKTNKDLWTAINKVENQKDMDSFFKITNDVVWGPSKEEKRQTSEFGRTDSADFNGFDIEIQFQWEGEPQPQTKQFIRNVHILGSSRVIMIDEQPVQEVYSFYAQKMS